MSKKTEAIIKIIESVQDENLYIYIPGAVIQGQYQKFEGKFVIIKTADHYVKIWLNDISAVGFD